MPYDNLSNISLEGFQVVSSQMFAHLPRKSDPTCTLWYNSIAFNKQATVSLNECEHIRIEINTKAKKLLIIPVTTRDKDAIRWIKAVKKPTPRKMDCKAFTSQLYEAWGWNTDFVYRTVGRLITVENKVMMLFDFTAPEHWKKREAGAQDE